MSDLRIEENKEALEAWKNAVSNDETPLGFEQWVKSNDGDFRLARFESGEFVLSSDFVPLMAMHLAHMVAAPEEAGHTAGNYVTMNLSHEGEPFYLTVGRSNGGTPSDTIGALNARIEALQAENREQALQVLTTLGQAQDAYEAQLKAEAERDRLKEELEFANAMLEAARDMFPAKIGALKAQLEKRRAALGDDNG